MVVNIHTQSSLRLRILDGLRMQLLDSSIKKKKNSSSCHHLPKTYYVLGNPLDAFQILSYSCLTEGR